MRALAGAFGAQVAAQLLTTAASIELRPLDPAGSPQLGKAPRKACECTLGPALRLARSKPSGALDPPPHETYSICDLRDNSGLVEA